MPKADGSPTARKTATKKAASSRSTETDELVGDDWFAPIDDVIDFTNTLWYGREGSGKSTCAAKMANASAVTPGYKNKGKGKVLMINAEGGVKRRALLKRGVELDRIVVWPDPKKHERASHAGLDRIFRRVQADLAADPFSWYGVNFDSATEIHQAILDYAQQKRIHTMKMRGAEVDEEFVDIGDYGVMTKLFKDLLRKYRDLPCHFGVTALERRTVDKDTSKPTYGPDVTPGLQSDLLGYVDFVIMCKAQDEDGPFRGLTRANSRYRAKDRFDVLPRVMCEPSADRIVLYLDGTLDEETDPEQNRITLQAEKAQDRQGTPVTEEDDEEDESGS